MGVTPILNCRNVFEDVQVDRFDDHIAPPAPIPVRRPPAHSGDSSLQSLLPGCQRSRRSRRYGVVSLLCAALHAGDAGDGDGQLLGEHKTRLEQHMSTPSEPQALAGWSRLNKQELESVELELLQLKRTSTKEYPYALG